jgi:hypothetical protein
MLAIGAGGLEISMALTGQPFRLRMPEIWGIRLTGRLPDWVSAKDVILEVLRRHNVDGGPGVAGLKVLAVNYRFVVPVNMPDIVADAIGRSILRAKAQLMKVAPIAAAQIEAPDVNDQNPLLPIHPGFAAYLSNGDQSFFDRAQRYLYIFGIPLSVGASLATLLVSTLNARGARKDRAATQRLLRIAREVATADRERLETLEKEPSPIV